MTDAELIEKARFVVQLFQECDAIQLPHKPTEEVLTGMIDRIEALTAEALDWRAQVGELSDKVKALEAEIVAREKTAYIKGTTDVWGIFKQD